MYTGRPSFKNNIPRSKHSHNANLPTLIECRRLNIRKIEGSQAFV